MLDHGLKHQLRLYLSNLNRPVTLHTYLDKSSGSTALRRLLTEITALSDKLCLINAPHASHRRPSFSLHTPDQAIDICFAGLPMGHAFSALVLALLHVGGHPPKEAPALIERAKRLEGPLHFETYFVQDCQSCPETLQALNLLATLNPAVSHVAIEGAQFPDEMEQRQVLTVPKVYLNGAYFCCGWMDLRQILDQLSPLRSQAPVTSS